MKLMLYTLMLNIKQINGSYKVSATMGHWEKPKFYLTLLFRTTLLLEHFITTSMLLCFENSTICA